MSAVTSTMATAPTAPAQHTPKKTARKSLAATLVDKATPKMKKQPSDDQLLGSAQSTLVDDILKADSDDVGRFLAYLRQRVELEEGYQNSLERITQNLRQTDTMGRPDEFKSSMYSAFESYVGMHDTQRIARIQYIQTMKQQLQIIAHMKEHHDRSRRSHRKNMRHVNLQYHRTRSEELPAAQATYIQKCQDIERATQVQHQHPLASPTTPSTPFPTDHPHQLPTPVLSDDELPPRTPIHVKSPAFMSEPSPMTPTTPSQTSPQRRIERFMRQFSLSTTSQAPLDPVRQAALVAKLKVEVADADREYRHAVRRLDALSKKQMAANEHAVTTLHTHTLERSKTIKEVLQTLLDAELSKFNDLQRVMHETSTTVHTINPEKDAVIYDNQLNEQRAAIPEPIYYHNYHVGECRNLLFGISLTEYSQQHQRSPPLIVTKCIEAVERLGGLEKEGLYRVSGKQSNIDKMKHAFERNEDGVVFGQDDMPEDVFSIGSVLKIFLRDLASPLFPFKFGDRLTYSQIPDKELRLMNLLTRILKLPSANYDTLKALMQHLAKLEASVDKNKMSVQNLTLIFTPAIFQDHSQAPRSPNDWMKDCVIEDLLNNCETLFANKDLRSASAITGRIDYGFDHLHNENDEEDETDEYDPFFSPSSSTFDREHVSSKADSEEDDLLREEFPLAARPFQKQEEERVPEETDVQDQLLPAPEQEPELEAVIGRRQSRPLSTGPKFRTVSQDRGLKVNTRVSISEKKPAPPASASLVQAATPTQVVPTAIQSATLPPANYDWLSQDPLGASSPTNRVQIPSTTSSSRYPLQRSATVGANAALKRTSRVQRASTAIPLRHANS